VVVWVRVCVCVCVILKVRSDGSVDVVYDDGEVSCLRKEDVLSEDNVRLFAVLGGERGVGDGDGDGVDGDGSAAVEGGGEAWTGETVLGPSRDDGKSPLGVICKVHEDGSVDVVYESTLATSATQTLLKMSSKRNHRNGSFTWPHALEYDHPFRTLLYTFVRTLMEQRG